MPELQPLGPDHAAAVLAFERANRAYAAGFISDRGDDWFEHFAERFADELAAQDTGGSALFVLVADDGSVIGRVNLRDIEDGAAVLGYRIAEHVAGRGVATAAVTRLCDDVAPRLGLRQVRAATSEANRASQRVLVKAGFVAAGPADPAELGGRQGSWFVRTLGPHRAPDTGPGVER